MFNVIMPFSRYENLKAIKDNLRDLGVKLILLIEKGSDIPELEHWITVFETDKVPEGWACYFKINQFIETIDNNEYYSILMDDDLWESDLMDKIKGYNNDIIIVSMKRGDNTPYNPNPDSRHPTHTLIADKSNMKVGSVGAEQFFVKGRIMKSLYFNVHSPYADGLMCEYLVKVFDDIKYVPDAYVLFNFLEKGRYNISICH